MDLVDETLYEVDVIELSRDGSARLDATATTPLTDWYAQKRRRALARAGLLSDGQWNPLLHPRGPDGRFISIGGLVRWLTPDGEWDRGKVEGIDLADGAVHVTRVGDGADLKFPHSTATSRLFSVPKAKAKLHLPSPVSGVDAPGMKKVGHQAGSNVGALYEVVDDVAHDDVMPGDKIYVKSSKSADHAKNEVLANRLYELAGVAVPDVVMGTDGQTVGSRIVSGQLKPLGQATPDELSKVRSDLAIDAWLANWDVVGMGKDNILIADGHPFRIDAGGSLKYRAQGQPKGPMFGDTVTELQSLRNSGVNPDAASIYAPTTQAELEDGGRRLRAITPSQIRTMVEDQGLSQDLADRLIARRKSVLAQIGLEDNTPNPVVKTGDAPEHGSLQWQFDKGLITLDELNAKTAEAALTQKATAGMQADADKIDEALQANGELAASSGTSTVADLNVAPGGKVAVVGEAVMFGAGVTPSDAAEGMATLVGKDVYIAGSPSSYAPRGFFHVESVVGTSQVKMTAPGGITRNLYFNGPTSEVYEVATPPVPLSQFTLKQNHDVVVNGHVVGEWKSLGYFGPNAYRLRIKPEFSPTGEEVTIDRPKKSQLKVFGSSMIMVPGPPADKTPPAISKTPETTALEKKATATFSSTEATFNDVGGAATLGDGSDVSVGMWVVSSKDGTVGKLVADNHKTYPGYVVVETYPDNKKLIRSAKTLYAGSNPETGDVPGVAPKWAGVNLGDGSAAFPSQSVVVASTGEVGAIVDLKKDGSVKVVMSSGGSAVPTGKGQWMKASKLKASPGQAVAGVTEDGKAAMAIADANPKPAKAPTKGKVGYPGPDGQTIFQPPAMLEAYRQFVPDRKVTKDGFVPTIGMTVRNSKGDAGVVVRLGTAYSSQPNGVWVYDPKTKKTSIRQASAISVDHAVELDSTHGQVSSIDVSQFKVGPGVQQLLGSSVVSSDGTSLIQVVRHKTKWKPGDGTHAGRYEQVDDSMYILQTQTGGVYLLNTNGQVKKVNDKSVANYMEGDEIKKVAVVSSSASSQLTVQSPVAAGSDYWKHGTFDQTSIIIHKPGQLEQAKLQQEHDVAAQQLAQAVATQQAGLEVLPFTGTTASITAMPKPANVTTSVAYPEVPPLESDASKLKAKPAVTGASSLDDAYTKVVMAAGTTSPGRGVAYSLADGDLIEDMAVRTQIAHDTKTDQDFVEVRFTLLEGAVDSLSDKLGVSGTPNGGWTGTSVYPSDLVEGDYINVRISSKGLLKPGSGEVANARVLAPAELVGSQQGIDLYRVNVATTDGTVSSMIIQSRTTPSIVKAEWNPNKVNSSSGFSINPNATAQGWRVRSSGQMGVDTSGSGSNFQVENGVKQINTDSTSMIVTDTDSSTMKLARDLPSGGTVTVQVTSTGAGRGLSSPSRTTTNGEVLIRVPAESPDPMADVSSAMSSVGVPLEKQSPPSGDDLKRMALNKVWKQLAPSYSHNQTIGLDSEDKVLQQMNLVVGNELGRPATIDDIMIRTTSDGLTQVVFSDDYARALARRSGITVVRHSSGSTSSIVEYMTSSISNGLLGADERWSRGAVSTGSGYGTALSDTKNDAGNRIFWRVQTSGMSYKIDQSSSVFLSGAQLMKKVDWYSRQHDSYGKRGQNNQEWLTSASGINELMTKRSSPAEEWGYVVAGDESERNTLIAKAKKNGLAKINGRPIEDVIILASGYYSNSGPAHRTVKDLNDLPLTVGVEVPLSDAAALADQAASTAPVAVAVP